ncbi:hypothetical protein MRB53_040434 [Persea americana]|nr:hypothetical protein MRB53_040434 [Persea americana]
MDTTVAVKYRISKKKNVHKSMLLRGHLPPRRVLDRRDLDNVRYSTSTNGFGGNNFNNDRYGNNNRSRDIHDPSQHRTAPKIPPWQAPPVTVNTYRDFEQPPPVPSANTFAPPPPRNGVPIPIPGFTPPSNGSNHHADPYSKYQASNGYNNARPNQWHGY